MKAWSPVGPGLPASLVNDKNQHAEAGSNQGEELVSA
jgi:hypothetical protein